MFMHIYVPTILQEFSTVILMAKKKKKERKKESASFTLLFSRSVVSDSLWPHGLQRARLPCPSPFPGACSNSCPSSQWCHLTISFSVICFSSYLQSFPAPGSLSMSWLAASGGQSIVASASASVLPMNIQGWFLLRFKMPLTNLSFIERAEEYYSSYTKSHEPQIDAKIMSHWWKNEREGGKERKMRGKEEKEEQKIIIFGFDFSQFCFLWNCFTEEKQWCL